MKTPNIVNYQNDETRCKQMHIYTTMIIDSFIISNCLTSFTSENIEKLRNKITEEWFEPLKQSKETIEDYSLDVVFSDELQKLTISYSITLSKSHKTSKYQITYTSDEITKMATHAPKRLSFNINTENMAQEAADDICKKFVQRLKQKNNNACNTSEMLKQYIIEK